MPGADNLLSGYVKLDAAVGGFKRGSVVLCSGPSDSCAGFFAAGALEHALSSGDGGAIILTTRTPLDFRKSAYKRGLFFTKFEESGAFSFVDAYSRIVGGKEGSEMVVNGPSDLAGIIANVAQCNARLFRKGLRSVFVMDSLSGLVMHNSRPLLLQFLGMFIGILKKTESVLFMVFIDPLDDPSLLDDVSRLVDVRLEFKREGGKDFVDPGGSRWIELEARKAGVA